MFFKKKSGDSSGGETTDVELGTSTQIQTSGRRKRSRKGEDEWEETEYKPINWKRVFLTPKYIPFHILAIAILVITVLITTHHDEVVAKLRPFSEKVRDLPAGWLIPIAILIIISFPPLFGHEVVALLCGVVYGLWIGFGIVAAGTFFGEIGTWFAFKYALRRRAVKLERTNLNYGALARLTRDGGFWVILIIRFSAIPSHFSTAVFSTCDVNFWFFTIATFLTLPKQLILVYLGVLLVQDQDDSIVKAIILVVSFIITVIMAGYIWWRMRGYKAVLLEEQAARKAARAERLRGLSNGSMDESSVETGSPMLGRSALGGHKNRRAGSVEDLMAETRAENAWREQGLVQDQQQEYDMGDARARTNYPGAANADLDRYGTPSGAQAPYHAGNSYGPAVSADYPLTSSNHNGLDPRSGWRRPGQSVEYPTGPRRQQDPWI